jgi:hypothetical protein
MVVVDCPWCDGAASVVASTMRCEACGVAEEIVEDAADELVVLAAA